MTETPKNFKGLMLVFLATTIILAGVCAFLTYKVMNLKEVVITEIKEKENVISEKETLIQQLESVENEYDQLSKDYKGLDSLFTKEKVKVKQMIKEIKAMKGNAVEYKAKVAEMENRLKDYIKQIQELQEKNQTLTTENIKIKSTLDSAYTENTNLTKKVAAGSTFKAYSIFTEPLKVKGEKETPTANNRKVDKIRVCFVLGENAVVEAGKKTIYVRIAEPDGTVMALGTDDANTFTFQDKKILYSMKQDIDFQNKEMNLCLYWNKTKDFKEGVYYVDIFIDNQQIGSSSFTLE